MPIRVEDYFYSSHTQSIDSEIMNPRSRNSLWDEDICRTSRKKTARM